MRRPADAGRVAAFMERLGRESTTEATVYLVGGASAVLHDWRSTTVDIDIRIEPDSATGALGDIIAQLKLDLEISVEFASPFDFLPELPGWRDRSPFVRQVGRLTFRHLDYYGQALAKVLRNVDHDPDDVAAMIATGLVESARAWELFDAIRSRFGRFPSIDEPSFRRRMTEAFGEQPRPIDPV
jgi:hypothetical protein